MSLNNFIIGKKLGKGSFGSVSLVTRKEDGKIYAMKSVNISKLSKKEIEAALNEIRILAMLSHPNIIGYKDAFYDEKSKTLNVIMEYADDGDISHKIEENLKRRLRFDESTIWEWIIQLLKGLKYLHDNNIMHRDLKCANIFLMKNGLLKIGDLNVSKLAKSNMARTQTGTPFYLAPEIWKDQKYDYKCDIWSMGCILYELCTSRPPFRGTSLRELSHNVLNGYYLPIQGFSNDIKELISKMLVVDAKKRASTNELLNSDIIQRRIKALGNNLLIAKDNLNSKKANLIKTIKLPRNIKDINLALPRNKYNQKEMMMDNDPYEKTKNIYMETINKLNAEKKPNNNKNNINNIQQQKNKIDIIYENPIQKDKNKENRYRNMYKDSDDNIPPSLNKKNNNNKINIKQINNKQDKKQNINRYGFNNYNNKLKEKGWFKNNYPGFKYNKPQKAKNCKVNYNKINYNDYCVKNKIDKKMNYHYYRENGYYNYNKAINEYKNKNKNVYKGPLIVHIKK